MVERAQRLFPPEHPDVMAALYSYAYSLFEMGDEDGGLDIEQQAMQIESSMLRSDAPHWTEEAGAGTVGAGGAEGTAGHRAQKTTRPRPGRCIRKLPKDTSVWPEYAPKRASTLPRWILFAR